MNTENANDAAARYREVGNEGVFGTKNYIRYPAMYGLVLESESGGLTKREHFAGMALVGLLSSGRFLINEYERAAGMSVNHADALIKALVARSLSQGEGQ